MDDHYLLLNASASEARKTANYSMEQWSRFVDFTRDEAMNLVQGGGFKSWHAVKHNVKIEVTERINKRLREEGIPDVREDVLRWRMNLCLVYQYNKRNKPEGEGNEIRKPFDPIRDV